MKQQSASNTPLDPIGSLVPVGAGIPKHYSPAAHRIPASAIASRLVARVREAGASGCVFIALNEGRAEEVAICFEHFAPEAQVIVLPPWDCLPYDRVDPSRESMGRRATALVAMAEPVGARSRVVIMSPEAALQRISSVRALAQRFTSLSAGNALDVESLRDRLLDLGYLMDDRVDEPGEFALLGQGIDVFSPNVPHPYRILVEHGVVASIRSYDPVTQRTDEPIETVTLVPSTELPRLDAEATEASCSHSMETRMLAAGDKLKSAFELMPNAPIVLDEGIDDRFEAEFALIDDARHARDRQNGREATAELFYLDRQALIAELQNRRIELPIQGISAIPSFILEVNPLKAAGEFVSERIKAGQRVALAGASADLDRLTRTVRRRLNQDVATADSWAQVINGEGGGIAGIKIDIASGFVDEVAALVLLSTTDVLGSRLTAPDREGGALVEEPELRIDDVVLHEDHGIAVLRALETVELDGIPTDTVRLEYNGGAMLLAPVEEFGRIWRYGAEKDAVTLDRLTNDAWAKRRAQLDEEIAEAARNLARLATERRQNGARVMAPPPAYTRFAAKFPYGETADQSAAIAAVIDDLSSGNAMNRLVCGDVGFGKTEVALRGAAIVALNGAQVAVVAPTTVLARQHFETFSRRFEGTDVKVALLSRVLTDKEVKSVKAGLADGSVRIVIATHAISGKDVAFADLALLVIDEEHRFGAKLKEQLRSLAPRLHVLSMSATPIPRTLASAMIGVQEASLLTTPPARRRPVRTELAPFDTASIAIALQREHRRAGQSFCVVPRIADIKPTLAALRALLPDLTILVAHGKMDISEMDEAMMRFANGDGDILLSTNIIENGLDVPRANTIIVFHADRFGLAQLHQLRGRVGRGRAQGYTYLLTERGKDIAPGTRSRLSTLLAFDRLGAGIAISARDLDLRGAGDLIGEEQAGHMKLIGLSLYQRLLARAVEKTRGNDRPIVEPHIDLGTSGAFPAEYVPEPVVRLNLYSRLQRFETLPGINAFADELEDRFGPPPPPSTLLIELARLKLAAADAGIVKISAGPNAIAIEFAQPGSIPCSRLQKRPDCTASKARLIFGIPTRSAAERLSRTRELVEAAWVDRQTP